MTERKPREDEMKRLRALIVLVMLPCVWAANAQNAPDDSRTVDGTNFVPMPFHGKSCTVPGAPCPPAIAAVPVVTKPLCVNCVPTVAVPRAPIVYTPPCVNCNGAKVARPPCHETRSCRPRKVYRQHVERVRYVHRYVYEQPVIRRKECTWYPFNPRGRGC